jgi:hypothetical protein
MTTTPSLPLSLPLFPLGQVLYPGGLLPLKIFEQRYLEMTKACLRDNTPFGVCQIQEGNEVGAPAAHSDIGCIADIIEWDVPHPTLFSLIARGSDRFRVLRTSTASNGLITAEIERLAAPSMPEQFDTTCREILRMAIEHTGQQPTEPLELDNPVWVSYRLAELLPLSGAEKQQLLAEDDTNARLAQLKAAMEYHGIIEKINKIN